mmetsp:Transcript_73509/g.202935  ORF Transcript_73509/g.202935 Transcript_73509/m.202935 type:complete len:361 (-) Transcript_73509:1036-2118(-)
MPIRTANCLFRSWRGWLPFQVEVGFKKTKRSRTHINIYQLELIHDCTRLTVVSRVPVHISLHAPDNVGGSLSFLQSSAYDIDVPILAEEGICNIQPKDQPPIAEAGGDLRPACHACEHVVPHSVLDCVIPILICSHIIARETHRPCELRGQIEHRSQAVHGSEEIDPRGHRTIDAAGRAHNIHALASSESLKKLWGHIWNSSRHDDGIERTLWYGAIVFTSDRTVWSDSDLPPINLFDVQGHVGCLLAHVIDHHFFTVRGMRKVHVHQDILELERIAAIQQLPFSSRCKLVTEDMRHPLETHVGVCLHKLDNSWDSSPVQRCQEPQESALVVTFSTHVGENQDTWATPKSTSGMRSARLN